MYRLSPAPAKMFHPVCKSEINTVRRTQLVHRVVTCSDYLNIVPNYKILLKCSDFVPNLWEFLKIIRFVLLFWPKHSVSDKKIEPIINFWTNIWQFKKVTHLILSVFKSNQRTNGVFCVRPKYNLAPEWKSSSENSSDG